MRTWIEYLQTKRRVADRAQYPKTALSRSFVTDHQCGCLRDALAHDYLYHVVIFVVINSVRNNNKALYINKGRCKYSGLFTPLQLGITRAG